MKKNDVLILLVLLIIVFAFFLFNRSIDDRVNRFESCITDIGEMGISIVHIEYDITNIGSNFRVTSVSGSHTMELVNIDSGEVISSQGFYTQWDDLVGFNNGMTLSGVCNFNYDFQDGVTYYFRLVSDLDIDGSSYLVVSPLFSHVHSWYNGPM